VSAELIAKTVLVGAGLTLFVGAWLQAVTELREYRDLVALTGLNEVAKTTLSAGVAGITMAPLSIPSIVTASVRLVELLGSYSDLVEKTSKLVSTGSPQRPRMVAALRRARNWMMVLAGSLLAVIGSSIELVTML
jgi:hypothetical protein